MTGVATSSGGVTVVESLFVGATTLSGSVVTAGVEVSAGSEVLGNGDTVVAAGSIGSGTGVACVRMYL